jgi:RNA polymerase sigma factor (TIGR02999 family)
MRQPDVPESVPTADPQVLADLDAVMKRISEGAAVDPETSPGCRQSTSCWQGISPAVMLGRMAEPSEATRVLAGIEQGDPSAAERLLPLVYDELRRLAAQRLAHEQPGQTLDATALVHEAYVRLVDVDQAQHWNSRGHFFAAAAEAMRRILVESARRKRRDKRGGGRARVALDRLEVAAPERADELIALDEALSQLAATDPSAAELVKLRYFAGLTIRQAAELLGMAPRTADFLWAYARSWLLQKIEGENSPCSGADDPSQVK